MAIQQIRKTIYKQNETLKKDNKKETNRNSGAEEYNKINFFKIHLRVSLTNRQSRRKNLSQKKRNFEVNQSEEMNNKRMKNSKGSPYDFMECHFNNL